MTNYESAFINAMADAGLKPAKQITIKGAGEIHRYQVDGDKSGSLNGWYSFDDYAVVPGGVFGSWKTGDVIGWSSRSDHELNQEQKDAQRKWRAEQDKKREEEALKVRAEAKDKANALFAKAHDALAIPAVPNDKNCEHVHPYILKKGIKPYGVKELNHGLVIPIRNATGMITSLQFIQADGSKKFLTGGEISGCYFAMGSHDSVLCICEGLATGASIREATGYAVAVAFNAGNLLPVSTVLRAKFPGYTIIICADNDSNKECNIGLSKAEGAAKQCSGLVSIPKFDANELIDGKAPTDFNDLHRLRGLDAVRAAVDAALAVQPTMDNSDQQATEQRLSRAEFEKLIDITEDFDVLTGDLLQRIARANLAKPAFEFLVSMIAKKANVPKSSLIEVIDESFANKKDSAKLSDDDRKVIELNKKHAVVPVAGRVLIANREYDRVMKRMLLTFSSKSDFETRYCNRKVYDRGDELGLGTFWLNHEKRAEYDGIGFLPGDSQSDDFLNLWSGWGVEPKAGSCEKYLDFVVDVICSGNSALFDYIIRWCAHLVQRPQELPETALVFRGKEGTGKNTFVDPLMDIVGREHSLILTSMNQVTGRFSGHLANALLVFCNEGVWGGDKSAQGALKSMITDEVQPIESKGRDITQVQNFKRLAFATNENWAVPRGADDRRYVIVDVSAARKGDYAYFAEIKKEMEQGGTAALMHFLLSMDISGWNPRMIPEHLSERGWELKIRSGGSIVQWYFEVLNRGWLQRLDAHYSEDERDIWPLSCPADVIQNSYVAYCTQYKIAHIEQSCVVGKALSDWGFGTARPRRDNPKRGLFYKLPNLDEAREIFSKRFSIPHSLWSDHEAGSVYS